MSEDDGRTWKAVKTGTAEDLQAVSAAGEFFYVLAGKAKLFRVRPGAKGA